MRSDHDPNEKKLLIRLGKLLMTAAAEKKKSLERLAYEADISKGYIYDLAKGKGNPSILILNRLANALDFPLCKLFKRF